MGGGAEVQVPVMSYVACHICLISLTTESLSYVAKLSWLISASVSQEDLLEQENLHGGPQELAMACSTFSSLFPG